MVCLSSFRHSSVELILQDFHYDPTEYETFSERDECPAGEVCTVDGDLGVVEEKKLPWDGDDE